MERPGIPLHDAPERYFDQEKWGEVLRAVGDRSVALALVSRSTYGEHFRLSDLANKIRSDFKRRLVDGSIVATGCSLTSVEPATIPGSRCRDLQPDFVNDRLIGRSQTFLDVRVLDEAKLVEFTHAENLLDRCIQWMQQRRREGESQRKVLYREASAVFGPDLASRTFDAAYKAAFSKPRGRPRINPPSSK